VTKILRTEVLVIGGGPAGSAAGFWLAKHGHDVTIVVRNFRVKRLVVTV
jgi:2-polyprenyl-6-methoxyphenol hydroxylase-like FAD-dependent oxidoreductase